jgi:3-methyladenine DNA glycosylase AlkC
MSTLLKDLYSKEFYDELATVLSQVLKNFDKKKFQNLIFDSEWEAKELKARMYHTAAVLHQFLPQDFETAAKVLETFTQQLSQSKLAKKSLECMFLPHFIQEYGIDDFNISTKLFQQITPYASCEFAVRPFIVKYEQKMIDEMIRWSKHSNHHVRRLASEGSRSRLPWAMALPSFKKNPTPIFPILENLKNDSSEYVRKSVANSLNDVAKDNPQLLIDLAQQWKGKSKETDWILKHGCRTLLKQGNATVLSLFGLAEAKNIDLEDFSIQTPKVSVGENLTFSFQLENKSENSQMLRIEYAVYYLLQNGKHAKKVFKISEKEIKGLETIKISKNQSFRLITTRKFYLGTQKLAIIINGKESELLSFELN